MTMPAHARVRVVVVYGTVATWTGGHDTVRCRDWTEACIEAERLVKTAAERNRPVQKVTMAVDTR